MRRRGACACAGGLLAVSLLWAARTEWTQLAGAASLTFSNSAALQRPQSDDYATVLLSDSHTDSSAAVKSSQSGKRKPVLKWETRPMWSQLNLSWLNEELDHIALHGRWKRYQTRPMIAYIGVERGSQCGLANEQDFETKNRTGLLYAWEAPEDLPWLSLEVSNNGSSVAFSIQKFCNALNGKRILVVGDSVQQSFSSILWAAMGRFRTGHWRGGNSSYICAKSHGVKPAVLHYIRNDFLSFTNTSFFTSGVNGRKINMGYEWLSHAAHDNHSVIVLNRGLHFEPMEEVLSQVNRTLLFLRQFDSLVFYRASNIPIPLANFSQEPQSVPLSFENVNLAAENLAHETYRWDEMHAQNSAVKRMIRDEFPHVVYLDIEWMTRFRTDSMRDPVHPCIPGPADSWVALFAHAILRLHEVGLVL